MPGSLCLSCLICTLEKTWLLKGFVSDCLKVFARFFFKQLLSVITSRFLVIPLTDPTEAQTLQGFACALALRDRDALIPREFIYGCKGNRGFAICVVLVLLEANGIPLTLLHAHHEQVVFIVPAKTESTDSHWMFI